MMCLPIQGFRMARKVTLSNDVTCVPTNECPAERSFKNCWGILFQRRALQVCSYANSTFSEFLYGDGHVVYSL